MGIVTELKAILAAEERISSEAIRCTIGKTVEHLKGVKAKIEELNERRKTALLTASDKELSAIDANLATERLNEERGEAALRILADRLDAVLELEREARAAEERARLNERADAVARRLAQRYPLIVEELRTLLRDAAEVDSAILTFEKQNPEGEELAKVEARVRFTPATRTIVREDEVLVWKAPNGRLFDDDDITTVVPEVIEDDRARSSSIPRLRDLNKPWRRVRCLAEISAGRMSPDAKFTTTNGAPVRPVRARRIVAEIVPADRPDPLVKTLRLPPLRAGMAGFGPLGSNDPRLVLAALSMPAVAPEPKQRVELIEVKPEDSE